MLNDPEMQSALQDLLSDPELMEMFSDANLMRDILSMDPEKMKNNPGIQRMMQNPKMLELMNRMSQKMALPTGNSVP